MSMRVCVRAYVVECACVCARNAHVCVNVNVCVVCVCDKCVCMGARVKEEREGGRRGVVCDASAQREAVLLCGGGGRCLSV